MNDLRLKKIVVNSIKSALKNGWLGKEVSDCRVFIEWCDDITESRPNFLFNITIFDGDYSVVYERDYKTIASLVFDHDFATALFGPDYSLILDKINTPVSAIDEMNYAYQFNLGKGNN